MTQDEFRTHAFRIQRMWGASIFGIAAMLKLRAAAHQPRRILEEQFTGSGGDAHRAHLVGRAQMGHHFDVRNLP